MSPPVPPLSVRSTAMKYFPDLPVIGTSPMVDFSLLPSFSLTEVPVISPLGRVRSVTCACTSPLPFLLKYLPLKSRWAQSPLPKIC